MGHVYAQVCQNNNFLHNFKELINTGYNVNENVKLYLSLVSHAGRSRLSFVEVFHRQDHNPQTTLPSSTPANQLSSLWHLLLCTTVYLGMTLSVSSMPQPNQVETSKLLFKAKRIYFNNYLKNKIITKNRNKISNDKIIEEITKLP